jgi:prevent-host-death family protein
MRTISTHEAKTHLSRYLAEVEESGKEFIIAKGKRPVARLIPLESSTNPTRPKVGQTISAPFEIPDDALKPLSKKELKEWGL